MVASWTRRYVYTHSTRTPLSLQPPFTCIRDQISCTFYLFLLTCYLLILFCYLVVLMKLAADIVLLLRPEAWGFKWYQMKVDITLASTSDVLDAQA